MKSNNDKESVIKKFLLRGKYVGQEELDVLAEYRLRRLEEISIGNHACYFLSKNEAWENLKALVLRSSFFITQEVSAVTKSKNFLGLKEIRRNKYWGTLM